MQVMPFWKKEIGENSDDLFHPETNISYGCKILAYYIKRYKKLDVALAAYNGSVGSTKYSNAVKKILLAAHSA